MIRAERLLAAAFAAGIVEASLGVVRVPPRVLPPATWLAALAITCLCTSALSLLVWSIARLFARGTRPRLEAVLAGVVLLPPVLTSSILAGRFFLTAFSNVELALLLSGGTTLVAAALAAAVWRPLGSRLERLRLGESPRRRWSALALVGLYLGLVVAGSAGLLGLRLLDPGLAIGTIAALSVYFACKRLPRPAPALLAAIALAPLLLLAATSSVEPSGFSLLARHGSWSKAVVLSARSLSDRDGDGFSARFAGGDCNDRDARVHPGSREVARDGLDNDCVGGDADGPPALVKVIPQELPAAVPVRPNLVIVTIETLRPDHLSLFGYSRPTTPRLAALAPSSIVFERTYAAAPATRLSLAALFSGRTPSSLAWQPQPSVRQTRRLALDNPWLPALLLENGYRTIAVLASFRAFTEVESAGFERGFESYDTSSELEFVGGAMRGFPGGPQIDRAFELLDVSDGRPFALWLHLVEPHHLYEQSPNVPSFGDDEIALYDAEIAEADRQLGRLVDGLAARSLLERTLLVVSGDHGEEFGEHGRRFHATNLYEAQVRTALLMRVPGLAPGRVKDPVVLTDLAPTLVNLLRLPPFAEPVEGRNLLPRLLRNEPLRAGFFLENFRADNGAARATALVEWPFKLIYEEEGRTLELYDLERDPLERANLYDPGSATAEKLVDRLHVRLESAASISPIATP